MSEAHFLMPRYWGSDDSDVDQGNKSSDKLEKILKKARKRKIEKLNNSNLSIEVTELQAAAVIRTTPDSSPPARKKRKRDKEGNHTIILENNEVHNSKIINQSLSENFEGYDPNSTQSMNTVSEQVHHRQSLQNASDIKKMKVSENNVYNEEQQGSTEIQSDEVSVVQNEGDKTASEVNEKKNKKHCKSVKEKSKEKENEDINGFTIIGDVSDAKVEKVQRILPNWLANPIIIDIDISGKECAISNIDYLDSVTKSNLVNNGIHHLFPVQTAVIPYLMKTGGKRRLWIRPSDTCVSAPTGSGKTLAYVLPIVQCLRERLVPRVRALVILPVGDLAFQVFNVFNSFCKGTDLHVALVTGQKSFAQEQISLVKKFPRYYLSSVDIIVATPGRLLDHISFTPGFSLEALRYLVIDEADRMMEEIQQGLLKKLEKAIFKNAATTGCCCFSAENLFNRVMMPPTTACEYNNISEPLIKLLFSATLSQDPEKLHNLSLYNPILYTASGLSKNVKGNQTTEKLYGTNIIGKYTTPETLKEFYINCDTSIKPLVVCQLIRNKCFKRVLCFTKSLVNSHRLHLLLNEMGDIKAREISSNLRGVQHKIILEQFASGKINVIVCSDLMARGMDIENVDCVMSYDPPLFIKNYIHRIGRTARAGREGSAITLLDNNEKLHFVRMLQDVGRPAVPPFDFNFQSLKTLESTYKKALNAVSKTITEEKRKKYFLKCSFKDRKKNSKFPRQ